MALLTVILNCRARTLQNNSLKRSRCLKLFSILLSVSYYAAHCTQYYSKEKISKT